MPFTPRSEPFIPASSYAGDRWPPCSLSVPSGKLEQFSAPCGPILAGKLSLRSVTPTGLFSVACPCGTFAVDSPLSISLYLYSWTAGDPLRRQVKVSNSPKQADELLLPRLRHLVSKGITE